MVGPYICASTNALGRVLCVWSFEHVYICEFVCVSFEFMCIVSFTACASPSLHPHAHPEVFVNICAASFCDTTVDDVY